MMMRFMTTMVAVFVLLANSNDAAALEPAEKLLWLDTLSSWAGEKIVAAPQSLPLTAEVNALGSARLADVGLALACIAGAIFVLIWGRKRGKLILFPVILVSIFFVFFTNTAFYEFKSVQVTTNALVVSEHIGDPSHISWGQITSMYVEEGELFPVFADDRMLVLTISGAQEPVKIPAFVPRKTFVAQAMAAQLGL
ncbi:MAG: hypothetical protein HUU55_15850 [Myxococcales bacterium]|nr:hypothetical protein [Myxococcales bacterium]